MNSPALTLERLDKKIDSVLETMDVRFNVLESKFDSLESRFETFEAKTDSKFDSVLEVMMAGFESVDARLDKHEEILDSNRELLSRLTLGQEIMQEDIRDTKKRVIHLEDSMEEVQYTLAVLTKAEEKDAEATINHELRLQGLEKINKIKAISPSHLTDIQA